MSIFHDGILVDVHVRYWSGSKLLTAEDLGLTQEEVSEAFKLGKKDLIPTEVIKQFRTMESRARYIVDSNSFEFPVGHANFLPKRRANKVFEELESCQRKYEALVDDLIENFPEYKNAQLPIYMEAAEKAWLTQAPSGVTEFSMDERETEKARFISEYIARIDSHYPVAETLRSRFALNWDVYTISLDAQKTTSAHVLSKIQRENEAHLHQLGEEALQQAKRTLDIEDYKAQTHERIGGFVDDVVKVLRKQTVDLCDSVANNVKNGQVVTGRTFNRISDFINKFQDMNFVGDTVVDEQLQALKREFLDVYPTDQVRNDGELQTELTNRLSTISSAVSNLSDVSDITGEYTRRVIFKRGGSNGVSAEENHD